MSKIKLSSNILVNPGEQRCVEYNARSNEAAVFYQEITQGLIIDSTLKLWDIIEVIWEDACIIPRTQTLEKAITFKPGFYCSVGYLLSYNNERIIFALTCQNLIGENNQDIKRVSDVMYVPNNWINRITLLKSYKNQEITTQENS